MGIVGYVGWRDAAPVLLASLGDLANGGHDSAGIALHTGRGLVTRGRGGRVQDLTDLMERLPVHGSCGIAYLDPATAIHPTARNGTAHVDCHGRIAVVVSGTITNAAGLREELRSAGHRIDSDAGTEVLAHLLEAATGQTLEARLAAALSRVEGAFAIAAVWAAEAEKIAAAQHGARLVLGIGDGEMVFASDQAPLAARARSIVALADGVLVGLTPTSYRVMPRDRGTPERRRPPSLGAAPAAEPAGSSSRALA